MNPAHIIRECLTDKEWGMGYSELDIDDDSFVLAANTLFDEQMGISMLWQRENTIEAFIQDIVRHIDAALYVDRRTGKFVLKLIRDDYSESDLILLGPDEIERIENYKRPAFGDLVNSVTVIYEDCDDGKELFVAPEEGTDAARDCITWTLDSADQSGDGLSMLPLSFCALGNFPGKRSAQTVATKVYPVADSSIAVRDDMIARLTDSETGIIGCTFIEQSGDGLPDSDITWVLVSINGKSLAGVELSEIELNYECCFILGGSATGWKTETVRPVTTGNRVVCPESES
jgi:hypothetical protein